MWQNTPYFINSASMPSEPGALEFFNLFNSFWVSSREGSSTGKSTVTLVSSLCNSSYFTIRSSIKIDKLFLMWFCAFLTVGMDLCLSSHFSGSVIQLNFLEPGLGRSLSIDSYFCRLYPSLFVFFSTSCISIYFR